MVGMQKNLTILAEENNSMKMALQAKIKEVEYLRYDLSQTKFVAENERARAEDFRRIMVEM